LSFIGGGNEKRLQKFGVEHNWSRSQAVTGKDIFILMFGNYGVMLGT
jgi:hypothetical protein